MLWLAASVGLFAYVQSLGSYETTYGSLGGVAISMFWLWLSVLLVIAGAAVNAESERQTGRDSTVGPERPPGSAAPSSPTAVPPYRDDERPALGRRLLRAQVLLEEPQDARPRVLGGGLVVVEPGDLLEHAERAGVVPVQERVPGVGVLLDVVRDAEGGRATASSRSAAPRRATSRRP